MRDLVEDFGFYIGPWNQAYMYDTLPITVDNEKDMKPGDLVFISATYFNPKSEYTFLVSSHSHLFIKSAMFHQHIICILFFGKKTK